jgi:hypothetical protein
LVSVLIVRPDGQQVSATAHLGLSYPHLYTRNPDVSSDKQLRVTVCFSDLAKEDVPAGSKILISKEVRDAILQSHAA